MIQSIEFLFQEKKVVVPVTSVLAAGYTGRDQQHVQEHVTELEEQGIAPPPHIPMLYPVMPTLLSNSENIAVLGPNSTPEIEVAIVEFEGERYVTVASDQTDRENELHPRQASGYRITHYQTGLAAANATACTSPHLDVLRSC